MTRLLGCEALWTMLEVGLSTAAGLMATDVNSDSGTEEHKAKSVDMSKVTGDVATVEKLADPIQSLVQNWSQNLVAVGDPTKERERARAYPMKVDQRAELLEKSIRRMAV